MQEDAKSNTSAFVSLEFTEVYKNVKDNYADDVNLMVTSVLLICTCVL